MPMEATAVLLTQITTTGTATYTRAQDPYCYFGSPQWKEAPVDPIADALSAAGAAADQVPTNAVEAARAVWGLLRELPDDPSVAVEGNEITLEWYKDRHRVAVIAVDGQSISWSVMAGPANPMKGKKMFDNKTLPVDAESAISAFAVA